MGKKKNNFNSYRKKRQVEKINNPRRANWDSLLIELRKEREQKIKQKETINTNNNEETNN